MSASDQVFEVYLRNADGETIHRDLRSGMEEFLDPEKGYLISINIEGIVITLRNAWNKDETKRLDDLLDQKSVEVMATIRGL